MGNQIRPYLRLECTQMRQFRQQVFAFASNRRKLHEEKSKKEYKWFSFINSSDSLQSIADSVDAERLTWTNALMRLAVHDVAVLAKSVGRFTSHLKPVLGVLQQIVNVRPLLVCAQRRLIDRIQFHFREPSHFIRFDRHLAVHRIVPG